ncbi:MAG: ABC transporter ATP-binding protein, partial [Rhodobacterales bacterium CG_4_10_14_0_8_um_filter_70_9]
MNAPEPAIVAPNRITGETLLEVRAITLRFGGVEALKNISFDIMEGEIRAIIGP